MNSLQHLKRFFQGVGCDIFKFDPVHSKPSSTFSQDLPGMPWNLNVFGTTLRTSNILKLQIWRNLRCPICLWLCAVVQSMRKNIFWFAVFMTSFILGILRSVCRVSLLQSARGLSGDMLCVNFQWSLLQRSCRGPWAETCDPTTLLNFTLTCFYFTSTNTLLCWCKLIRTLNKLNLLTSLDSCSKPGWGLLWACLDIRQKQPQNPEEEVPEAWHRFFITTIQW